MARAPLAAGFKTGDAVMTNDAFARSLSNVRRPKLPLFAEVIGGSWERDYVRIRFTGNSTCQKIRTEYLINIEPK